MATEVREKKPPKVYEVARELKLESQTLVDYLESLNYDLKRKHNTSLTDDMYEALLKKFDSVRFQTYHKERSTDQSAEHKQAAKKLRSQELDDLLKSGSTQESDVEQVSDETSKPEQKATRKIGLPTSEGPVILKRPAKETPKKEEKEEVVKVTEEIKEELPKKEIPKEEPVPEVETPKEKKRFKVELPVAKEMVVISSPPKREAVEPKEEDKREVPVDVVEEVKEEVKDRVEPVPAQEIVEEKKDDKKQKERYKAKTPPKIIPSLLPATPSAKKQLIRKKTKVAVETPEEELELKVESKTKTSRPKVATKETPISAQVKKSKKTVAEKLLPDPQADKKGRKKRSKNKKKVSQAEVAASIRETISQIEGPRKIRRRSQTQEKTDIPTAEETISVTEYITTQELAKMMEVSFQEVIQCCLRLGMKITINQRLDRDTIEVLASEFDCNVSFVQEEDIELIEEEVSEEKLEQRPPVVTIMGHVDHGKTTLLDYLRNTKVAEGEAGGITQHIGAYEVIYNDQRITFLDTPGHEAFTAMRARGAKITDIVVLVVAADDSVMSQTLEAIDHARAAGTPIVIAVNKIDKPNADVNAVYTQLSERNILVEKWGGKYQSAEISAKFGEGVDDLLQEILIVTEIMELKADPSGRAKGVVVESRVDKGLGIVATILVQSGTLKIGDFFVAGQCSGKVRSLLNEKNNLRDSAGPSVPVQVVGFNGVPQAGDRFVVVPSVEEAREISTRRQRQQREMSMRRIHALSLESVNRRMKEMDLKDLPLIIKGDAHGSIEALADALMKLSNEEVNVQIIHRGVGAISESDVLLASASDAIIIGFHVHPNLQAKELARKEGVEIRLYRILYDVVSNIKDALEGMLAPLQEEHTIATVEVRQVFRASRLGNIAGCYVTEGKVTRNSKVRLIRDGVELWSGEIANLKRFKEDAREVSSGFECGITLNGYKDVREGDIIQVYEIIKTARKLETVT